MASRLKKKGRKKACHSTGRMIHINTYAGTFRGRPRGRGGWIVLDSYEINPGVPPEQVMQTCGCPDSGEIYSKPFQGLYRDWSEPALRERIAQAQDFIRQMGGTCGFATNIPTWLQLEMLENIIDFELNPPCGCKPGQKA